MRKGLCETPWSSQADALHTFKGACQRVIDTCEILVTDHVYKMKGMLSICRAQLLTNVYKFVREFSKLL
jgi:hypothetical protein